MTGRVSATAKLSLQKMEIIDLPAVSKLEVQSYPPNEAASSLLLEYRIVIAHNLCYVAFLEGMREIIGFIVGTAAPSETSTITSDTLRDHYPPGNVLCIHSIVIRRDLRRKGLGSQMLQAYLSKVRAQTKIKKVLLLSKPHMLPFYLSHGFNDRGEWKLSTRNSKRNELSLML